jgi:hypothetical protein
VATVGVGKWCRQLDEAQMRTQLETGGAEPVQSRS